MLAVRTTAQLCVHNVAESSFADVTTWVHDPEDWAAAGALLKCGRSSDSSVISHLGSLCNGPLMRWSAAAITAAAQGDNKLPQGGRHFFFMSDTFLCIDPRDMTRLLSMPHAPCFTRGSLQWMGRLQRNTGVPDEPRH